MAERTLRIGFDAHAAGAQKTGNERFIVNLLRALPEVCDHQIVALVPDTHAAEALSVQGLADSIAIERFVPGHPLARHLWSLGSASRELDALVVQYAGPLMVHCPTFHVVHDASFATHPEWFPLRERLWMQRLIPWSIRRGAGVITVSETARDELIGALGLDPALVHVARDGVDPIFSPDGDRREPSFIAVGANGPRKNLGVISEAVLRLRAGGVDAPFVYAGPDEPPTEATALGYLADEELAAWVRGAIALVYPSRYEGFGLPPLEAMASGTPALVADIPVMHEVCGDAAIFIDPDDPGAWAEAMTAIATEGETRSRYSAAGLERSARFTWQETARTIIDVIERQR